MSGSAEALANQAKGRNVSIEITNNTDNFCLLDPKVFQESGHCHSPPQPIVRPWKTEVCNFSKNVGSCGAVGVLTYDVFKRSEEEAQEKIALMFSVPFDYNFYKNWVAVGIFKPDRACDKALYEEMYYEKKQENFIRDLAKGCCITMSSEQIQVMCVMSPMGRAIMKVEMWEKSMFPEW